MSVPTLRLAEERIAPDEAAVIARIVDANLKTLSRRDGVTRRGQHAAHQGCVEATFTVRSDVPETLRFGLFAKPSRLRALIRFSNGTWSDESKADAHGMAIKVIDIPGEKLMPGLEHATEQDFLLVDHPVFFTRTPEEYWIFNLHFTKILDFVKNWRDPLRFLPRLAALVQGWLALRLFHADLRRRANAFAGSRPRSPLAINYWSTTPYLLGAGTAVKFAARPVGRETADAGKPAPEKTLLTQALRRELSRGPARFDFGVQVQTDPVRQPVEDATVDWDPDGGNFVPLAQIEIRRHEEYELIAGMENAEHLLFSPWLSLAEHRPLGNVNRARLEVYVAMAYRRRAANRRGPQPEQDPTA